MCQQYSQSSLYKGIVHYHWVLMTPFKEKLQIVFFYLMSLFSIVKDCITDVCILCVPVHICMHTLIYTNTYTGTNIYT